jgi:glycosyltransferase involved in cell wall biosynthesis
VTKVLFISFVHPFPADDGKKAVLQGLVRYFLAHPHIRVEYVILGEADIRQTAESRLTFHPLSRAPGRAQLLLAFARSFLGRRAPLQQTLLYNDPLQRAIRQRMVASKPDIVIYDTIRVSQFIANPRALLPEARHVLYMDDLFSVRYGAMLEAMDRYPRARVRPLGNFAKHLPKVCQPIVNTRRLCRYFLKREMQLVKDVERAEVARFDVSLLVNGAEVKLLRERSAQDSIAALPISLPRHNQPLRPRNYEGRPDFIFMGALNVAHNQCSIEYFITNIFEDCLKSMPNMKLRVIGQAPSERLRSLFARYPRNIESIAWVSDLGQLFAQASAMLVPLLFGSGVKVKTLEALSYALPVISTRFGAEGIVSDPTQASGIIIENDLMRFPQHMRSLLDLQNNDRISRQAHQYYLANYGAEAIAQEYRSLFGL